MQTAVQTVTAADDSVYFTQNPTVLHHTVPDDAASDHASLLQRHVSFFNQVTHLSGV